MITAVRNNERMRIFEVGVLINLVEFTRRILLLYLSNEVFVVSGGYLIAVGDMVEPESDLGIGIGFLRFRRFPQTLNWVCG